MTTVPPGFNRQLLTGLAKQLDSWGVGRYLEQGTFPADAVAVVLLSHPESPPQSVALTTYSKQSAVELDDEVTGLQIRCRGKAGARSGGMDLADLVFDRLHGATGLDLGGVWLVQAIHTSGASLGPDTNSRWEWSSNYDLYLNRPSTNRPD